jgi:hypothetical protein
MTRVERSSPGLGGGIMLRRQSFNLEHISVGWNRGIPNALSMSESAGIDSFFGASDAEALFRRLACPSD